MKAKPLFALVVLLATLGPARAELKGPPIKDGAKLYSKRAIDRATEIIKEIRGKFGIDVCIETLEELPAPEKQALEHLRSWEFDRRLREIAQERAYDHGVRGLYALIILHPRKHAVVIGWPSWLEREKLTSDYKRDELRRTIAVQRGRTPDEALLAALDHYRKQLGEPAAPSPLPAWHGLIVIGCLLGLWVVLAVVRARVAARQAVGGQGAPPLYLPAVQASLFGVPAGYWVTDRLFHVEPDSAPRVPALPVAATEPAPELPASPPPAEKPIPSPPETGTP